MSEKVDGSNKDNLKQNKNWNRIIVRHSTAWFLLLFVLLLIWKWSEPLKIETVSLTGEDTATATVGDSLKPTPTTTIAATVTPLQSTTTTTLTLKTEQMSLPSGADRVQVMVDDLNIRSGPDANSRVIGRLSKGTIVAVESRDGKWMKIKTVENKVGYISTNPRLTREAP